MENQDTGFLLSKQNISLQRTYFKEMCRLLGLNVLHRAPREGKTYNGYGELDTFYYEPVMTTCIYDEHPSQKSMKKLGWNAELQDNPIVIHVPYDLKGLQAGSLFIIPSGLDNAEPRKFRVIQLSNIAIYPASIACELGLEWETDQPNSEVNDFKKSNFTVLLDPPESDGYTV